MYIFCSPREQINQLTKGANLTHSFTCPHDDVQKVLSGQAVLQARREQHNIKT